jgi:ribulose-5-phosphate 4-epimerase/fuculose-1-phosphate aldolase
MTERATMLLGDLRERIVEAGVRLVEGHLVYLSAGNISARDPGSGLIAVKPGGGDYLKLRSEDILVIDSRGKVLEGQGQPSSETPMHLLVYERREDIRAVIHTHSPVATAWSVAQRPIPPVTVGQCLTNGPIPFAPYRRPGTDALGEAALTTMGDGCAVILQNHGVLAAGPSLDMALAMAFIVEEAAVVAFHAMRLGEDLRLMTEEEYRAILTSGSKG